MMKSLIEKLNLKKKKDKILINILTRTSNRPRGFKKCHDSIKKQSYKNVRHIVSFDTPEDLDYLKNYDVDKIRVTRKEVSSDIINSSNKEYKPYNLYCNELLKEVEGGWIMFLDDDDVLKDKRVLRRLVNVIQKTDEDTLIIGFTRYPNGVLLPSKKVFKRKEIKIRQIDTACFVFHSKYQNASAWDCWWAADFRFVKKLSQVIPKQFWLSKVLTRKNTAGGLGKREDLPR